MQKNIIFIFLFSITLFSSPAYAWRESTGGNGVKAEEAIEKAFLLRDLKNIPVLVAGYNFTADTDSTSRLLEQYRKIKNIHFNSSFPIEREIVQSLKNCEIERFNNAFELIGDRDYVLKNISKKISDLLEESKCIESQQSESITKQNKVSNLRPSKSDYLFVQSELINKMKLIPSLDHHYFSCLDCQHPERLTRYKDDVYLRGQKVDAYTTQKVLKITTIVDRSAWRSLSDNQKRLLTMHEMIHFLIDVDVNYNLSVKVEQLLERYDGLKRFYPETRNFIEKAIAVNLSECDLGAFKENYALLREAAYFYKINGVRIPNAIKQSGCTEIIKAVP
jgi:hypothetical protein